MAGHLGYAGRSARAEVVAQVIWTWPALASLEMIRAYIGDFNPLAAQRMALRLTAAGMSLAEHPLRGRAIGRGRRELVTVPPYLIRSRVQGDTVEISHPTRRPKANRLNFPSSPP